MKKIFAWIGAVAVVTFVGAQGFAQATDVTDTPAATEDVSATSQDIRAPSPRINDPDRTDFFQIGLGPAVGVGLESDNVMYNIYGAYNRNFGDNWSGKVLADIYMADGADAARMYNIAVGADYFFTQFGFTSALPYTTADIGWGAARNADEQTESAPVIGVGAGMKFLAGDLNWDVNAHYTLLTNELADKNPSVLGLRAAVNF